MILSNVNANNDRNRTIHFDEDATCEVCGRFGAYPFEDERLCPDCYQQRGSCCGSEFGNGPSRFSAAPECEARAIRSDRNSA
jgi:hypothetical protein